jgi:hypothetical protein
MSTEQIAQVTGLTIAQVTAWLAEGS